MIFLVSDTGYFDFFLLSLIDRVGDFKDLQNFHALTKQSMISKILIINKPNP